MKGGYGPSAGWSSFDPRTGKPASSARPPPPRTKSAYEYFKATPKMPTQEQQQQQSPKKKQGFAPRGAGGDEPMARNTSAYSSTPRKTATTDRASYFEFVPTSPPPTARKASASESVDPLLRHSNNLVPELERASSRYATTGGEKTYLSSSSSSRPHLGRSASVRDPLFGTVPSPTGRHRSASPKYDRSSRRRMSSSSPSSGSSSDAGSDARPKAVPKSRLRPNQKFSDFHPSRDWKAGTGEREYIFISGHVY